MIRLERSRDARSVPAGLRGEARVRRNRELLEGRLAGKVTFEAAYWRPAKAPLKRESRGKCAYCEASTEVVAHGDVEHFRPKKIYWWLAYCYDNMLYACQICNQIYKHDKFPVEAPMAEPALPQALDEESVARWCGECAPDPLCEDERYLCSCRGERAGLVNPYLEDPEPLFQWRADDVLREVEIVPLTPAAETCVALYGLNREELRRWRYRVYKCAEILADVLAAPVDAQIEMRVRAQLRNMCSPESEFAAMIRHFVRQWKLVL